MGQAKRNREALSHWTKGLSFEELREAQRMVSRFKKADTNQEI